MIMMSNDLPWFTEQCGQSEIEVLSDGSLYYKNRWYDIDTGESSDMDRAITCSIYRPADCRIALFWEAYWSGTIQIISTDYTSYAIEYSYAEAANIDYMQAVWVYSRDPLVEGTTEFDTFYATIEAEMADKLPKFKMRHLSVVEQDTINCVYSL